jgi:hypothetical protein
MTGIFRSNEDACFLLDLDFYWHILGFFLWFDVRGPVVVCVQWFDVRGPVVVCVQWFDVRGPVVVCFDDLMREVQWLFVLMIYKQPLNLSHQIIKTNNHWTSHINIIKTNNHWTSHIKSLRSSRKQASSFDLKIPVICSRRDIAENCLLGFCYNNN